MPGTAGQAEDRLPPREREEEGLAGLHGDSVHPYLAPRPRDRRRDVIPRADRNAAHRDDGVAFREGPTHCRREPIDVVAHLLHDDARPDGAKRRREGHAVRVRRAPRYQLVARAQQGHTGLPGHRHLVGADRGEEPELACAEADARRERDSPRRNVLSSRAHVLAHPRRLPELDHAARLGRRLLPHDRVCPWRQRRAGEDARRLAPTQRWTGKVSREQGTNHAQPRRPGHVLRAHRVPVHGGAREGRRGPARHGRFGQPASPGFRGGETLPGKPFSSCEDLFTVAHELVHGSLRSQRLRSPALDLGQNASLASFWPQNAGLARANRRRSSERTHLRRVNRAFDRPRERL
jgi:hypothetical protein